MEIGSFWQDWKITIPPLLHVSLLIVGILKLEWRINMCARSVLEYEEGGNKFPHQMFHPEIFFFFLHPLIFAGFKIWPTPIIWLKEKIRSTWAKFEIQLILIFSRGELKNTFLMDLYYLLLIILHTFLTHTHISLSF